MVKKIENIFLFNFTGLLYSLDMLNKETTKITIKSCCVTKVFNFLTDIDECIGNACGNNAVCINTLGSFDCRCIDGYLGNPFTGCLPVAPQKCGDPATCSCNSERPCPSGWVHYIFIYWLECLWLFTFMSVKILIKLINSQSRSYNYLRKM